GLGLIGAGLLAATGPVVAVRRRPDRHWPARRVVRWPLFVLGGLVTLSGLGVTGWAMALAGGDRSPTELTIAPGIDYQRISFDEPRRQVVHLALIDLDDPCLVLDATRPATDGEVLAETTTEYVERTGATVAVNVAFFYPIEEYPHWDSYPTSGDPVTAIGHVVVERQRHGRTEGAWGAGLGLRNGRGWAGPTVDGAEFEVPGRNLLIVDGTSVADESESYPRTVAGVDTDTNRLVLLVADGKQPGYAEGMTYQEVAELLLGLGVDQAVEFDGGGSSTMVATIDGRVELLSRPSHQRIPGRERPVATHLGVTRLDGCG
ncbi:MAG: phosphodiester glycosidase family protein, partial [Actinomycetota bacterium]